MHGVVVGRFQPLHNGHLAVLEAAMASCGRVTVGIGSSTAPPSLRNPFSADEREAMVRAAVGAAPPARADLRIVHLPDLDDDARWVRAALAAIGPADRFFGNDDRTASLFAGAGVPVVRTGLLARADWEGTALRRRIAAGDPGWRDHVPGAVARLLDAWDAGARLRRLAEAGPAA